MKKAKLYLVPTPIGNIEDITLRARNVLEKSTVIFCEDTRETASLLKKLNIANKKLVSSHDHNEEKTKETVLEYLKNDIDIVLVSDRGTPIISDPGYKVVRNVIDHGYDIISLPGATAFVPALTNSGIEPSPFLFYGFLNNKTGKRKNELEQLKNYPFTIIFYESPNRVEKTLSDMLEVLGNRKISISREISKLYEETYNFDLINYKTVKINYKGEFVIVVSGNKNENYKNISVFDHIELLLKQGLTEKDALKKVAKERNINKSTIYNEYQKRK